VRGVRVRHGSRLLQPHFSLPHPTHPPRHQICPTLYTTLFSAPLFSTPPYSPILLSNLPYSLLHPILCPTFLYPTLLTHPALKSALLSTPPYSLSHFFLPHPTPYSSPHPPFYSTPHSSLIKGTSLTRFLTSVFWVQTVSLCHAYDLCPESVVLVPEDLWARHLLSSETHI